VALLTQAGVAGLFVLLGQAGSTVQAAYGVLVSMTFLVTFVPFVFVFAAAIKLQGAPAAPGGFRVPGGRFTVTAMALVGLLTTVVSMFLTLLPPPDDPAGLLTVGKVGGLTLVLLLAGAGLFVRGRTRAAAGASAALAERA
jgi:amino acid transporter